MVFSTIVFGSGANRGIMLGGVVQCLEERGILKNANTFVGTSIGALFAGMCAIGLSAREIQQIIMQTDIQDSKPTDELEVLNLYQCKALYTNRTREKLVSKIIARGCHGHPNITFKQVRHYLGITLIVTACCLNTGDTEYISYRTHPDMPIARGICMSMTIPYMFEPYIDDDFVYVDGAVFGHSLPEFFDHDEKDECLGFKLHGPRESMAIANLTDFTAALLRGWLNTPSTMKHTVDLVCDVGLMDNVVSLKKKHELMLYGYETTKRYIDAHS